MNLMKTIFSKAKQEIKIRHDCDYLGVMAGHQWYKPSIIDDTITDRYLDYISLSNQYDTLGLRFEDLHAALYGVQDSLRQNKTSLAAEINSALISYVELQMNNDIVFSLVNCFIMVDDEPLDKITPEYTKIKKELYNSNDEVKIFFCECYNGLKSTIQDSQQSTSPYNFLKSRLAQVSESLFLKSLKMAQDIKSNHT